MKLHNLTISKPIWFNPLKLYKYKICNKCKELKLSNLSYFHARKVSKDGLRANCKDCGTKYTYNTHNIPEYKTCTKCKKLKPCTSEYFSVNTCNQTGFNSQCKMCRNLGPETKLVPEYQQCTKCKEIKHCNSDNFGSNKRTVSGFDSQCRDCTREYKNRPDQKQKEHEYKSRPEIKENHSKYVKEHQINNPEIYQKATNKYRANKIGIQENFSVENRKIILSSFKEECFKCKSTERLEIDHFRPLSKGYPLTFQNAVILCRSCNSKKRAKDPEEFFTKEEMNILKEEYGVH